MIDVLGCLYGFRLASVDKHIRQLDCVPYSIVEYRSLHLRLSHFIRWLGLDQIHSLHWV